MARKKYHVNPVTLALEQVDHTFGAWFQRSGLYLIAGIIIGAIIALLVFSYYPTPSEKQVRSERSALKNQYKVLEKQVDQMQIVLTDLQQRDDNFYRALLQAEPIPLSVRLGATQRVNYYDSLAAMTDYRLAADLTCKVDLLQKEVYEQARSYEELLELTKTQEIRMENIPAIQPVLNKDLTRVASGYGYRIDPIYHTPRFHAGMDFTAPTGTDIYATGNGRVTFVGWRQGYGNTVIVDHGFGYETLYAHLSMAKVYAGQHVHRGDVIALVGNTGKSTGPHLHYEVHFRGAAVDPRNFYFQDLNPEEYDRMVQLSNNFGNLLD